MSALTLLLVSGLSFLAGFLVHAQFFAASGGSTNGSAPPLADRSETAPRPLPEGGSSSGIPTAESTTDAAHPRSVEGRITYRSAEGNSKPDAGATVIFLPRSRSSSVKLPIVGFRPADHQEDREIARAAVRALGGDVCQAGEDGRFAAHLEQAGSYHVLVLSHYQQRDEFDQRLSDGVKSILSDYFDRPEQLPGRRRYHLGQVSFRGAETEIWDYTFERI
jgi:hypothetical protein